VTEFRYLTAAEWGMRWARPPVAERTPDTETYVHHTAGAHPNNAVTAFYQLNEYAITQKNYSAVDYDILVHRDPRTGLVTIGEARGPWLSAATLDRNEQGEAICLLGYFHPGHALSREPHPDELEGVALGIVWGIQQGWIARDTTILGHRDNPAHPGATGCPGDYLQAKLPAIRNRVAELLEPPAPPEEPPMYSYFKRADGPGTLWQVVAPGVAIRVQPETLSARHGLQSDPVVLTADEADCYEYLFAAPAASTK
jgi:hypothetical protein